MVLQHTPGNAFHNKICSIILLTTVLSTVFSAWVRAEIVTDGSLGAAQSLTGPNFAITADLGQQRGGNLFHSFSQFNIANTEAATFSGPAAIANIISRVTGGNQSTIDGLLRSEIAGANLFLLNPAGVLFGPNASLDISGSLHVGSGDYLALDDLTQFLATPIEGEILTAAAPVAFGFLGDSANGAIQIQGTQLTLSADNALTLVGNGITIESAEMEGVTQNSSVTVEGGDIQLASIAEGEVSIDTGEVSGGATLAGITIRNQSTIDVDGEGGGRIVVRGGELTLEDSALSARTEGSLAGRGVDIQVDDFNFTHSRIDTSTTASGGGKAGTITVNAAQFALSGDSLIAASTWGTGDAGDITIDATDFAMGDASRIFNETNSKASDGGDAGIIEVFPN